MNFLDSNVLVYLFDDRDAGRSEVARQLVSAALRNGGSLISHQVVQETLNTLTRKLPKPVAPADAARIFDRVLAPLWRISPSASMYRRALEIQGRLRFGFYDSLIVAAALESGCTRLYSEDLQHGQRIEGLTIENPFGRSTGR